MNSTSCRAVSRQQDVITGMSDRPDTRFLDLRFRIVLVEPDAVRALRSGSLDQVRDAAPDQGQCPIAEAAGQPVRWVPVDLYDRVGHVGDHWSVSCHDHCFAPVLFRRTAEMQAGAWRFTLSDP